MKVKEGLHYKLIELFGDGREMAEEGLILDVSQQLFEVMEDEGITKSELASRLDCSKAYITKLLRGPSNMTLRKVAEVFFTLGRVIKLKAVPVEEETEWECVKTRPDRRRQDAADSEIPTGVRPRGSRKKAVSKTVPTAALHYSKTHGAAAKKKTASTGGGVRKAHTTSAPRKRTSRVGSTPARKKSK